MSKPYIHAKSSAKKHGGTAEDYLDIHNWFDRSKEWFPDNRHRIFTHHAEGIFECERVFGVTRVNSAGRTYSVRDIGEQHVAEDFGGKFIPTVSDYMCEMSMQGWMNNGIGGFPPSYKKIDEYMRARKPTKTTHIPFDKTAEQPARPAPSEEVEKAFAPLANMPRLHEIIPERGIPEVVLDGASDRMQRAAESPPKTNNYID